MSVHDQIEDFCTQLRRRQVEGSLATGRRTAELLRIFISTNRQSDALALIQEVRSVGNKMQASKPLGERLSNEHPEVCMIASDHFSTCRACHWQHHSANPAYHPRRVSRGNTSSHHDKRRSQPPLSIHTVTCCFGQCANVGDMQLRPLTPQQLHAKALCSAMCIVQQSKHGVIIIFFHLCV